MAQRILIVDRPPQPLLRKLAEEAGKSPEKYFQDLLLEHGNQRLAARAIGVSTTTLSQWKARLGFRIDREDAA